MTLSLAGQLCGLPVSSVRDVLRQQAIAPVALSAPEIAGNLNLRGHIVTAIDLRRRLQLHPQRRGGALRRRHRGERRDVCPARGPDLRRGHPGPARLRAVPPTLPANWARYSAGLYRLENGLMIVLDLPQLLALSADPS